MSKERSVRFAIEGGGYIFNGVESTWWEIWEVNEYGKCWLVKDDRLRADCTSEEVGNGHVVEREGYMALVDRLKVLTRSDGGL